MSKTEASIADMVNYIPANMFGFITHYKQYSTLDDAVQTRLGTHQALTIDIQLEDGSISTFYFTKDHRKHITARIDCISSMQEVIDYITELNSNEVRKAVAIGAIQGMWDKLNGELNALGYKLVFSHGMNYDCWGWHDLSFLPKNWNEQNFRQAQSLVFKFTIEVEKLVNGLKGKVA